MTDACPSTVCARRIATLERELALAQTDLGNVEVEQRKTRRRETKLKADLRRALGEDEMTEQVKLVIAHFNSRHGRNLKFRALSANDEMIRKALRSAADTTDQAAGLCFEAIDGLAVKPYVVERNGKPKRSGDGEERQRHDKLENCLRNEETILRFAGYAREAREGGNRIPDRQPVVGRSLYEDAVAEAIEWAKKAEARKTALELLREFGEAREAYCVRLEAENAELRSRLGVAA